MADYELWLTDDAGKRITLLPKPFWLTYTRALSGLGTINFGVSFRDFSTEILPYFVPDWRLEVWREPTQGAPLRREDVFMLRQPHVYTRDDNVEVLQFYGRNGIDLLMRRSVIQRGGTSYALKTDNVDDMMKAIVREQMLYGSALDVDGVSSSARAWPSNEFSVQADLGLGPTVSRAFADRNVFEILKELKEASFQLNVDSSSNRRIYFDVVPRDLTGLTTATASPLGWEFQTFADRRGADRTDGIEFSVENNNIEQPSWSISHLDEVSSVIVRGNGQGVSQIVTSVTDSDRVAASRWNLCEKVISAASEASTAALQDAGRSELFKGKPKEELDVTLLNVPGSEATPRSLYGLDWDLGDLVRVNYAKRQFEVEINIVYVSVDETGKETITGRSAVQ